MKRKCNHCNETKDHSEFHKNPRGKDGIRPECALCSCLIRRPNTKRRTRVPKVEHIPADGILSPQKGEIAEDFEFPDYWATPQGAIYSSKCKTTRPDAHLSDGTALRRLYGSLMPIGYIHFGPIRDGDHCNTYRHAIVFRAFKPYEYKIGIAAGLEICHNNGIKTDDRLSNLRMDTHQSNCVDRENHRVGPRHEGLKGAACPTSKLTDEQVVYIREQRHLGRTNVALAKELGIANSTVSHAASGRTYTYLGNAVPRNLRGKAKEKLK